MADDWVNVRITPSAAEERAAAERRGREMGDGIVALVPIAIKVGPLLPIFYGAFLVVELVASYGVHELFTIMVGLIFIFLAFLLIEGSAWLRLIYFASVLSVPAVWVFFFIQDRIWGVFLSLLAFTVVFFMARYQFQRANSIDLKRLMKWMSLSKTG
jgi:hypothetical protein